MVEIFDDIRKIYKFSPPCEELKNYIEFFSESSAEKTALHISAEKFSVKMFESWTPTIWFNLGTPYHLAIKNKSYAVKTNEDILLLRNTIVTRHVLHTDHIFTVKFFPGGIEAVLGFNQANLTNQVININTLLSKIVIEAIKRAACFEDRIILLQNYFISRLQLLRQKDHYIKIVQDLIVSYKSGNFLLNTSQSAEKMFISSKTINRYFNNVVGIGPKKYFSVLRARAALTEYTAGKSSFIPSQFGYYDMSHFYKAIKKFTGKGLAGSQE